MTLSSLALWQPLAGMQVIELADDPSGELTGKLLAHMGADVVKVERPLAGDERSTGPFVGGVPNPENSLRFWYYNTCKRSVAIDVESAEGIGVLRDLIGRADVFVHTLDAGASEALGLGYETLSGEHSKLIVCAVTGFGQEGPWAAYKTSDLVGLAAGGPLHMCGYDDHSIPPIKPGENQGYHIAGACALEGILLAMIQRELTGTGRLVDISMHECLAVTVEMANPYWFYNQILVHRQTARGAMPFPTSPSLVECDDGRYVYVALEIGQQRQWHFLLSWLESVGLAVDLVDEAYEQPDYRRANFSHIWEIVVAAGSMVDADVLFHALQTAGLPAAIINAPEDLLTDPHLKAREFFVTVGHEGVGDVAYPGPPYRVSGYEWQSTTRAPHLGEHTDEVLAEWLAKPIR